MLIPTRYSTHLHLPLSILILLLFSHCPLVRLQAYLLVIVTIHSSIDNTARCLRMLFPSVFIQILLSFSMKLGIVSLTPSFHTKCHCLILLALQSFGIVVDIKKKQIYVPLKPYLVSILFMLHTQLGTSETQTKILLSLGFGTIHLLIALERVHFLIP